MCETHNVFIEKVKNIAVGASDDKRMRAPEGVTICACGYGC